MFVLIAHIHRTLAKVRHCTAGVNVLESCYVARVASKQLEIADADGYSAKIQNISPLGNRLGPQR